MYVISTSSNQTQYTNFFPASQIFGLKRIVLRQQEGHEFKASLGYLVDTISENKQHGV